MTWIAEYEGKMAFLATLGATAFLFAPGQITSPVSNVAAQTLVEMVLASTTTEWEAAFSERGSRYTPPRVVYLRPPPGHPARGAGYARTVGLVIDLGDVEAILAAFPDDGRSLVGLMVAHEVGHHVQAALGEDPEVTGAARERQADCLAGWWIVRAAERSRSTGAPPQWPVIDISSRLPATLNLLDVLQSGRADGGATAPETHGTVEARATAFEQGMLAETPWVCLWGLNP